MIDTTGFDKYLGKKLTAVYGGGRSSHAVLVSGGTAELRMSVAQFAAKLTVCRSDGIKPCGSCEACRKASSGVNPDIFLYEKPSDKRYYVKKDVQEICESVYRTPNESEVKVCILSELQNMNEECQNLLLKILEEPPSYTAFVLTASSANTILPTVLSRVAKLSLGEGSRAGGTNSGAVKIAGEIAEAVLSADEYDIIRSSSSLEGNKGLFEDVLCELILIFRDALTVSAGVERLSSCPDKVEVLTSSLSKKQLLDLYDSVNEIYSGIDKNKNQTLLLTSLSAMLRQAVQL